MLRVRSGVASLAATAAVLSFVALLAIAPRVAAQSSPSLSNSPSTTGPANPAIPAYNPTLPAPGAGARRQSLASTETGAPSVVGDPGYRLGPGDQIHITVFGQPDMTGNYQIDGKGMLAFPLIGRVHAGGLTAAGLQEEITHRLSPDYIRHPSVSVEVLNYRPFYILGEVNKPGAYPYVNGMTVLNAAAIAGGFTYRAKDEDFSIMRNENGQHVKLDANDDTPVRPGDVITIPERFF
jgi:protein involved in polysaccharide export with SLBB domain